MDPNESVGSLCIENGHARVVEYLEITKELAERRDSSGKLFLRLGSIANHFFTLPFLKLICGSSASQISPIKLPYHVVMKKVSYIDNDTGELIQPTTPNAYKFESFIFDAFYYSK